MAELEEDIEIGQNSYEELPVKSWEDARDQEIREMLTIIAELRQKVKEDDETIEATIQLLNDTNDYFDQKLEEAQMNDRQTINRLR